MRAAIFDFDGLIIDSENLWKQTDIILLKEKNIIYDDKIRDAIRGLGQKESIELYKKRFGLRGGVGKLISERRRIFYGLAKDNLTLLKGTSEIIGKLHEKGFLLAVATGGHTKEKIKELLNNFDLADYFSVLVSSDEVKNGKPDPEIYLYTAQKLEVKPSECYVLEDAVNGVLAGKAAGMKTFGVNKDKEIRKDLEKAGADRVFSSLLDLLW